MRVLGYHIEPCGIANSDSQVCQVSESKEAYLAFLLEPHKDAIKVFRNLDYAMANLAALLGLTKLDGQRIHDTKQIKIGQFEMEYLPAKYLSVKYGEYKPRPYDRPFAGFSDMEQYEKWEVNDEAKTIESCLKEAQEAQRIGLEVYHAFEQLGLHPTTLTSPIRVYEKEVLDKLDIPTVADMPDEVWQIANQCCHGNWVEAYAKGYWRQIWDYDIESAYAAELMKLPDLRQGEWVQEIQNHYTPSSFGFLENDMDITAEFSPIIFERKADELYTPRGKRPSVNTNEELSFMEQHKLGSAHASRQWWWIPTVSEKLEYPFRKPLQRLYSQKGQDKLCDQLIKRIGSGVWGRMLFVPEANRIIGKFLLNHIYAALVESRVRLAVAKLCLDNHITPLSIALDGCVLDKPINPIPAGWKLNYMGPAIVVSSGIVALEDKSDTDFSLGFNKLKDMILADSSRQVYTMTKLGFVSLSKALLNDRWADLGKVERIERSIDIAYESKRYFESPPQTGGELLAGQFWSEAWNVHELKIGRLPSG